MVEAPTAKDWRSLPTRLGRYEIVCELGHGGMAVLYLARSVGLGGFERLFAIKMIHEHLSKEPRFVQMFLDEARLVARIRHPNVTPVYEVDVDRGRHYLSMDYISGETLGAALRASWPKGDPFPLELALYVVANAAEGLHAAHELRGPSGESLDVVHRDMSPDNIMLGYDGSVRVMDFGVAKAIGQIAHSRPGSFKGTPAYMSPEQIRGAAIDRRSDIFGLGVILWEATVGKRLFKDKTDITTAARVLKMAVPPPTRLRSGYPTRVAEIIERAIDRDPNKRHSTARQLSEELHDFLATSGRRVSAGDVESFMQGAFGDRMKERREMEQRAMSPLAVSVPPSAPTDAPDDSWAAVSLDAELDLELETEAIGLIDSGLIVLSAEERSALRGDKIGVVPKSPLDEPVGISPSGPPPLEVTEVVPTPLGSSAVVAEPPEEPAPNRPSSLLVSLAVAELDQAKTKDEPTPDPITEEARIASERAPTKTERGTRSSVDPPPARAASEITLESHRELSDTHLVVPVPDSALTPPFQPASERSEATLLVRDREIRIDDFPTPGDSTAEVAGIAPHRRAMVGVAVALLAVMGLAFLVTSSGRDPVPLAPPPSPPRANVEAKLEPPAPPPPSLDQAKADEVEDEPPLVAPPKAKPSAVQASPEAPEQVPPKEAKSRNKRSKGKKWNKLAPALFHGSDL